MPKGQFKKDTSIAVFNRRTDIMNLLLSGVTHSDLIVYYQNNYPTKSEKSLELDITWAYTELKKYTLKNVDHIIDRHCMLYDKIAIDCMNDPYNRGNAIKALQAKEKLLKMHNPDILIQNNTQNNTIQLPEMTVDQIKELLSANE